VRLGLSPQINALATLMLVAVGIALLAARLALRGGRRGA
jgi:ABC-type spermidine/putrescine transport system permease subunit II